MRDNIRKHLIQPICFYLGNDKPYWAGKEEEEGHWAAWEAIFGEMSEKQLKYLAKYYMETVYPQIRKEIQRSKRVYFPSPADMQSYLAEIKDEKQQKEHSKFLEERQEIERRREEEDNKAADEIIRVNKEAQKKAEEFVDLHQTNKELQYKARCFRFDSNGYEKKGPYWEITKNHSAADIIAEIIKSGKLEEFERSLDD